jgi:hypothetical protein
LQNRTWTDHSGFRIGRGTTRTGSEYASFTPEGKKKKKKKEKKRARVASFLTRAIISLTVIVAGKKKEVYLYPKKQKKQNICR